MLTPLTPDTCEPHNPLSEADCCSSKPQSPAEESGKSHSIKSPTKSISFSQTPQIFTFTPPDSTPSPPLQISIPPIAERSESETSDSLYSRDSYLSTLDEKSSEWNKSIDTVSPLTPFGSDDDNDTKLLHYGFPKLTRPTPPRQNKEIPNPIPIPKPDRTWPNESLVQPLKAHLKIIHPGTPQEILSFIAVRLISPDRPYGHEGSWRPVWKGCGDLSTAGVGFEAGKGVEQIGPGREEDERLERMYGVAKESWKLLEQRLPGVRKV